MSWKTMNPAGRKRTLQLTARPRVRARRAAVSVVFVLLAGACGGDPAHDTGDAQTTSSRVTTPSTDEPSTATSTAPTTAAASVSTVEDLVYRTGTPDPALIDVYHSTASTGGPVVVLFHGGGVDNSFPLYVRLAEVLGEQGAVVFVPDWDTTVYDRADDFEAVFDGTGCAVAFALAHAGEYGASPDALVLVGHSAGAAPASIVAMRDAVPISDCVVDVAPFRADAMVMWDGDHMLSGPLWDSHHEHLPELMEAVTLWAHLDDGPKPRTLLITAARSRVELRRCDVSDPSAEFWVRDPDEWFRDHLTRSGALDDDCIDIGDVTDLLAETMQDHGFDARQLELPDSRHERFSNADRALAVDEILGLVTD